MMAYQGVGLQGMGDAGDGVPARANPVRQSKLSYGQVALQLPRPLLCSACSLCCTGPRRVPRAKDFVAGAL